MLSNYESPAHELAAAFGYLTHDEVTALIEVAREKCTNDPLPFVNIGAGAGTSALSLRIGCPTAHIITIDISPGGPLGGLEGERNAFEKAGLKYDMPEQILGDSAEIGKDYNGRPLSIIFVDGDHTAPKLTNDINSWLPHLCIGGYIIFHDYGKDKWPDVKTVVDAMMSDFVKLWRVDETICFVNYRRM